MQNKLFSFPFKLYIYICINLFIYFSRHEEYVRPPCCKRLSGRLDRHHMGEALAATQITQRSSAPLSDLGCSSDRGFNHTEGKVRALWCPTGVPPLTLIPFSKHISERAVGFSIYYSSYAQLGLHAGGGNSAETKWVGSQLFSCHSCALKRPYGISAKTMLLKQAALFHCRSVHSTLSFPRCFWASQKHC